MIDINEIKQAFIKDLGSVNTSAEISKLRIRYLGKKGIITENLKLLSTIPSDERPAFGKFINEVKEFIAAEIDSKESHIRRAEQAGKLASESVDITLPGKYIPLGRIHPINRILK